MSITDTIDNAIRDYGLSTDAMRWLPDEPPQAPHPLPVMEFRLDADRLIAAVSAAQEALHGLGVEFTKALIMIRKGADPGRRARLRRMHFRYPAKWRKPR